jgi:tetratricopeptide (TPR) repeat protein
MALVPHQSRSAAVCACAIVALCVAPASGQVPDPVAALNRSVALAEASLRSGERQIAESHYRTALLQGWMIRGALHFSAGQFDDARRAFERASASTVDNREALIPLAIAELQSGRPEEAVRILTAMTRSAPRNVQLKLTLAQALVALDKPAEAAQELDAAQTVGTTDPSLLFALASGYLRVKKVEAAEVLFARVTLARPGAVTYVLIGRTYRDFQYYDRARAALRRALKMDPRVSRAHYYLGTTALLEEGVVQLDEAISEFRRELAITPGDPLATLRLGVLLVEARRYEEALPLLEGAVRAASPPYDAWMFLGRCQLARGRPADAVVSFRRALEAAAKTGQDGRRHAIHYQLATALRDSGQTAEAEREFAEAQRQSVERVKSEREQLSKFLAGSQDGAPDPATLPLGMAAAFENLTEAERASIASTVDVALARTYLNLGIAHAQAGRFSRAAELFEAAAAIDRAFPQVQYSLGVAYFNAEQYDKAIPALTTALEQQPKNADVSRMLALASLNTGEYGKAAELLRSDPTLPSTPSLQYAFGLALVRSNRVEEAERIFARVLSQHPDVPELNVVLGQIHAAQGDFDQAVAALRRAIALKRDVPEAHAALGDIYMRQGQFGPAAEALRAELASHPKNVAARNTLATVLELDGKSDEALTELRAILAATPNYANARYLLGKILLASGAAADAVGHLELASRLAPDDANIHYQLGLSYQRLGRGELAAKEFEIFQRLKDKARGGKS